MLDKIKTFFLKNTSAKQTVVKNAAWLFAGEIGMRILKLAVFVYAARKLGVAEWGVFSYVIALMATVAVLSDIGINNVLLRETAQDRGHRYVGTGFFMKIGLSAAASVILLASLIFISDPAVRVLIPIAAIILFLDSMREFGFSLNRAFEKMETEAFGKIVTSLILVVVGIAFIWARPSALSLAYGYAIASLIGVIIMLVDLRAMIPDFSKHYDKDLLMPIFREAWPLALVGAFGILMSNADTVMLGWMKGSADVGLYAAAQKPIQLIYLVPSLIGFAFLPVMSRLATTDREKMRRTLGRAVAVSVALSLPIAVGAVLLGHEFIVLLFGTAYAQAAGVFALLSVAVIGSAPGIIASNALFAEGKQKKTAVAIAIGAASNIVLCLALIPRFGIYGAAIGTTVAQLISNGCILISTYRIPELRFSAKLGKILLASVIMGGAIVLLRGRVSFAANAFAAAAVYALALFALQEDTMLDIAGLFERQK